MFEKLFIILYLLYTHIVYMGALFNVYNYRRNDEQRKSTQVIREQRSNKDTLYCFIISIIQSNNKFIITPIYAEVLLNEVGTKLSGPLLHLIYFQSQIQRKLNGKTTPITFFVNRKSDITAIVFVNTQIVCGLQSRHKIYFPTQPLQSHMNNSNKTTTKIHFLQQWHMNKHTSQMNSSECKASFAPKYITTET